MPDGLVYGPVASRRFGRSLGVSFSLPGRVACAWRCPYCQLGGGSAREMAAAMADPAQVLAALDVALAADPGADVVTVAGAGEPLAHPAAPDLLRGVVERAHAVGLPVVCLTNGDRLHEPERRGALLACDAAYVKWDPGAPAGAWRQLDPAARERRLRSLATLPDLRIQTMLYRRRDGPGNADAGARRRWLAAMVSLGPTAVQLATVDRAAVDERVQPVASPVLVAWARAASTALPTARVRIF